MSLFLTEGEARAQIATSISNEIQTVLTKQGFENVAVFQNDSDVVITYENRIYRHEARALREAIKLAVERIRPQDAIVLVPQKRGVPVVAVRVDSRAALAKEGGHAGPQPRIEANMDVEPYWRILTGRSRVNSSLMKLDVTVHPQLRAQFGNYINTVESQVNLAPDISTSLWKGMSLSAQWIFPIQNELGYEGDHGRPGLLTLNQTVRLNHDVFLSGTMGYFTQHRYGADLEIKKFWGNGRWAAGINAGCTGFSAYVKGVWYWSDMDTWTGYLYGERRFARIDLTVRATYGSFIYRDKGFRVDFVRQFGEVSIGFFTVTTTDGRNGGFSISVPLLPSKRLYPSRIRISPASQFPWSYRYSGLTDQGMQYTTGNSVDLFFSGHNPDYLENQINGHSSNSRGGI